MTTKSIKTLLVLGIVIWGIFSFNFIQLFRDNNIIAITNTAIINVENGEVQYGKTILIKDGIITGIQPSGKIDLSPNATIINGKGKYIIPGLWDMHVHTSTPQITREVINPLFIANGVTGVRVLSADCFEPCWELQMNIEQSMAIQSEIEKDQLVGPEAIHASAMVHGAKPGEQSTVEAPGTIEDAKKLVHLLQKRNVDFIKIYNEVPRDVYFAIAEEANKIGLAFAGHVPLAVKTSEASDVGQKSIEHCCSGNIMEECSTEEQELRKKITALVQARKSKNMNALVLQLARTYDSIKCQAVFDKLKVNNTFFTPTLIASEMDNVLKSNNWRNDPRLKYIAKKEIEFWEENEKNTQEIFGEEHPLIREKRYEIVNAMNRTGVKLLAGSDCGIFGIPHGFGLHDELKLLVEAGLTELEALQTATTNPADFIGRKDSIGKVQSGMKADLVLLNTNPLENIGNTKDIFSVVVNGKYFKRSSLDTMLEDVAVNASK